MITAANDLPSQSAALELISSYLNGHHMLCPFISKSQIMDLYGSVYLSGSSSMGRQTPTTINQDLFRLNMVFAIGSVRLTRNSMHPNHPLGYYIAAMQHFESIPVALGPDAIQNLLFLAEFTILQDTGCSVWDIGRICMRSCLLLDLHREQGDTGLDIPHSHRLIFWACYSLDRVASTTLGRPYAISDADICTEVSI